MSTPNAPSEFLLKLIEDMGEIQPRSRAPATDKDTTPFPFDSLALEIQYKIFEQVVGPDCVRVSEDDTRQYRGVPKTFNGRAAPTDVASSGNPMTLAQVCKSWKAKVDENSNLWSTIRIDDPLPEDVPYFKAWLERTKEANSLLNLTFEYGRRAGNVYLSYPLAASKGTDFFGLIRLYRQAICESVNAALEQSERIRSLTLHMQTNDNDSGIHWRGKSFPELVYVSLYLRRWPQDSVIGLYNTILKSAPKLKHIDIDLSYYLPGKPRGCIPFGDLRMPWGQLKSLCIPLRSLGMMFTILQACPELEEFDMIGRYGAEGLTNEPADESRAEAEPIPAPKLRTFKLLIDDEFLFVCQALRITAPALETLVIKASIAGITCESPAPEYFKDALVALGRRSGCRLKTLSCSLGWPEDAYQGIHVMLKDPMFQYLENLHFGEEDGINEQTLRTLTFTAENRFLPRLRSLKGCFEAQDGEYARMLYSRVAVPDEERTLRVVDVAVRRKMQHWGQGFNKDGEVMNLVRRLKILDFLRR
ncbi:hypothetical protein CC1G_02123 [Coprinopsis cinerea okayama7|uniref:F-box domain-containing protein n=1 Tax=Coprinopsis cinerea (strain Okayama-7 / 130 / ATCC MYA-4618 / FGSC 9003) TaxID=240176 RepID=A8NK98_COPC7|nr:hypothetical protein CC1G_02123 [Coprinopsis cinerea okayama7\|eukprot:XP_001834387.1 hypothetical protein CC1G_02123 [Coprinopsis cinerea okayama7\